jgi:hypothetical protein
VTTSNYSPIANSHNLQFTTARTMSSQSAVSSPVDFPLLPGSRPRRLAAISHQPPTLLAAVSILLCNGSWSSLYSLDTDRTGNTASNSSSIFARFCCGHYLVTAVIWLLISQSLPSNWSTSHSIYSIPCHVSTQRTSSSWLFY